MRGLARVHGKANGAETRPLSQKSTVTTLISYSWSLSGFGFSLVVSEMVVQMKASSSRTRSVSIAARYTEVMMVPFVAHVCSMRCVSVLAK
jgi:hypothetical protein